MAQPFVHGAVHIYMGAGFGGTSQGQQPSYLGTGERAPRYSFRRSWERLFNDIGGVLIPFDYSYQGVEGFVTVKLTRWTEATLTSIQDSVKNGLGGGLLPGTTIAGELGTLMVTEGAAVPLWIQYSYGPGQFAAKAAMATQPSGYHFFASFLEGPDDRDGGTDPATVTLTFHAIRIYDQHTGNFLLFDNNMAALPPGPPQG